MERFRFFRDPTSVSLLGVVALLLASCVAQGEGVKAPPAPSVSMPEIADEDDFVFDEFFAARLTRPPNPEGEAWSKEYWAQLYFQMLTPTRNFVVERVETETDEYGTYSRYFVALREEYVESIPLIYIDQSPITDFSEDEVRDAIRFFANYAMNEWADSPALDNPKAWDSWWEETGRNYFHSSAIDYVESLKVPYAGPIDNALVWIYDTAPMVNLLYASASLPGEGGELYNRDGAGLVWVPLSVRDGSSRVMNKQIQGLWFERIDGKTFSVGGNVAVLARKDYDAYTETRAEINPLEAPYLGLEHVGKEHEMVETIGAWMQMYLQKEDGEWKLVNLGYDYQFHLEGFPLAEFVVTRDDPSTSIMTIAVKSVFEPLKYENQKP